MEQGIPTLFDLSSYAFDLNGDDNLTVVVSGNPVPQVSGLQVVYTLPDMGSTSFDLTLDDGQGGTSATVKQTIAVVTPGSLSRDLTHGQPRWAAVPSRATL